MKRCSKCKTYKDINFFYKNKSMRDGLESYCKSCSKEKGKLFYKKNKGNVLVRETRQSQNEKYFDGYEILNGCCWRNTVNGKYQEYKISAFRRGLSFLIGKAQFAKFWEMNCKYCGSSIDTIGLDRTNNDIGYIVENVVSCCEICNRAKLSVSIKEWYEYLRQISEFQKGGKTLDLCEEKKFNKSRYLTKHSKYKYAAKSKKLKFDLSKKYFETIMIMPCHYCGRITVNMGIDRKDNNIGYIKENCVPCCVNCNSGKRSNDYEVFLRWIKKITQKHGKMSNDYNQKGEKK